MRRNLPDKKRRTLSSLKTAIAGSNCRPPGFPESMGPVRSVILPKGTEVIVLRRNSKNGHPILSTEQITENVTTFVRERFLDELL